MISIMKKNDDGASGWRLFGRPDRKRNPNYTLEKLAATLDNELKIRLRQIDSSSENLTSSQAIYIAIDNVTNVKLAVEKFLSARDLLTAEAALILLEKQIALTAVVAQSETVSKSELAAAIAMRTLNLLFCAAQKIKQNLSVAAPLALPAITEYNGQNVIEPRQLTPVKSVSKISRLKISSTLLYQLHHSLFPAERMLVGAGKRNGSDIEIDGIFDVTGKANAGNVQADPNRLARALIVMSETDRFFAFWIHSHPGGGRDMTHPSSIDLNQEADWLEDYSPNLVNAIVVEDRYIRFWGKSLREKRIAVEVMGTGIRRVSETEEIYQLEF